MFIKVYPQSVIGNRYKYIVFGDIMSTIFVGG